MDGVHPKTKEALKRKPDASEPMSALAFKTVAETNGDLVYIRVYSGEMKPGEAFADTGVVVDVLVTDVDEHGHAHDVLDPTSPGCNGAHRGQTWFAFTRAAWSDCTNASLVYVAPEMRLMLALCARRAIFRRYGAT